MVSEAMLLVERSFGTGEERSSSSCGSEKVSHEGDEGKADGKMQEKRKERPELKVVICKDGRSSARVGHIFTGLRCPWGLWGSMGVYGGLWGSMGVYGSRCLYDTFLKVC